MSSSTQIDLTQVCRTFPLTEQQYANQIRRVNILDALMMIFDRETQVVILEGPEGIGKTSLAVQFAKAQSGNTFSLFVQPTSRYGYDRDYLRLDLCNQLYWAIYQEHLQDLTNVNDAMLQVLLFQLRQRATFRNVTYYFVVDGLDQIPDSDLQSCALILDLLPIGLPGFRFVLTGASEKLRELLPVKTFYKPYQLPGFTPDETARYLGDLSMDETCFKEINKVCRGIPGYLAAIRRLVSSGTTVESLVNTLPERLPDLFRLEWSRVSSDESLLTALAVVAHDSHAHLIEELAQIVNIDQNTLESLLTNLGFIQVDVQTREVRYVSESFRRFASTQLRGRLES